MTHSNEEYVSPHWAGYRSFWWIVAILLFLFLLITWLMGYGPGGKRCAVAPPAPVEVEKIVEKIVEVPVADTIAPRLTLNKDSVVRIMAGSSYADAGAVAMDNIDGDITVTTTGSVDTTTPGEYVLTYTVTDVAGNATTETRTVIVEAAPEAPMAAPAAAKLYFENDSAEFPADTELTLSAVIAYLRRNSGSTAIVQGYHSATGSAERNKELSKQRAQSVGKLLQESGVDESRIVLEKPLETTGTGSEEEARRVEVSVR